MKLSKFKSKLKRYGIKEGDLVYLSFARSSYREGVSVIKKWRCRYIHAKGADMKHLYFGFRGQIWPVYRPNVTNIRKLTEMEKVLYEE